jgi:hypothetical protein
MPSSYKALLVSNSDFPSDQHNLFPLQGPVNDAPLLRDALTDRHLGLFAPNDVRLLPERSKREIMTVVEQFFRTAERDDQLLIYYSGHGLRDINDNFYLCARDTVTSSLVATGISDSELNAIINMSPAPAIIVILDCCYSGAFKGPMPAGLRGEGRFVITSCRRTQLASDAQLATGASPFTGYLIEGLRLGTLDANGDGYVALNDLYDYALRQLRPTGQIPQRHFYDAVGDLILARARQPGMHTPAPPTGRPVLALSAEEINLDVQPGDDLPAEIIDVFNLGGGELDWTVTTEADWVDLEPQPGWFRLTMHPQPGINWAKVLVRDRRGGGSRILRVHVTVETQPTAPLMAISEQEIDFGLLSQRAKCPQRTIRLHNQGNGQLHATAEALNPRIKVRLLDDSLELQVDTTMAGRLDSAVVLHSNGGDARIVVRAVVQPGPILKIEPSTVDFGRVLTGQQSERLVRVINAGRGELEWTHGSSGEFFTVQRVASGLRIRHDAQPPGRYHGSVWIQSNGGEVAFDVELEVVAIDLTLPSPHRPSASAGHDPTRRRRSAVVFTAAIALVAFIGIALGLIAHSKESANSLDGLIADFESSGFPPTETVRFDSNSTSEYFDYQLAVLRELGLIQGVRWRANHEQTDQQLEVRVFQFPSHAQAVEAQWRMSICFTLKTTIFPTPGITASQGRRCTVGTQRVQEVTFIRGARLYKLKLSPASRNEEMIMELSRVEVAVAR